ncbi:ricin-type beta-trefoil lectin domain protein [Micromonospora profundi]|uniref:RICIN domain-containing protein n=1 Tax=Micromonospora profundi TaxID=1420889 RepID=UPI00364FF0DF
MARKNAVGLLVVLLATVSGVMGLAGPANAEPTTGQLKNKATGRCLDSNSQGDVYTLPCNGGRYQRWNYTRYYSDSTPYWDFKLKNDATGRCLDGNAQGEVYTRPCQSWNEYQSWHGPVFNSSHRYIDSQKTKRNLDSNAAGNVYTNPRTDNNDYQQWVFCSCS